MSLPTSGAISFANINTELSAAAGTVRSLNDAAVRTLFAVASGAISMSNGHGKSSVFKAVINTNLKEVNLAAWAVANGWDGTVAAEITVNSGIYIWSDNNAVAALTTGSFPGGLTLINNGYIIGKGGAGGGGGSRSAAGGAGGPAMNLQVSVRITNNGYIAGGGGGGVGDGYVGGGGGAGGGAGGGDGYAVAYVTYCGVGGAGGGLGAVGAAGQTIVGEAGQLGGGGGGGGRVLPGAGGAGGGHYEGPWSNPSYGYGGGGGGAGGGGGGASFENSCGQWGFNGGNGGSANGVGGADVSGGGGGWGASGGGGAGGGAGGRAVQLNGYAVTWNATGTIYGAVA